MTAPDSATFGWSARRSVSGIRAAEAPHERHQREAVVNPKKAGPARRGPVWLRLVLILIVVALLADVLPTPWALNIGGHFSALGEWDGFGPVQASNGGSYLLFTHLHGGILNGDDTSCSFRGCESLSGSAQLCTRSGRRYTFGLSGAVHTWLSTDGALTTIELTGGTPKALPPGWVVAFHGIWRGPVLPVVSTDNSFTKVFTPAGSIRSTTSTADAGTARGQLRFGSAAAFASACNTLTGTHP